MVCTYNNPLFAISEQPSSAFKAKLAVFDNTPSGRKPTTATPCGSLFTFAEERWEASSRLTCGLL